MFRRTDQVFEVTRERRLSAVLFALFAFASVLWLLWVLIQVERLGIELGPEDHWILYFLPANLVLAIIWCATLFGIACTVYIVAMLLVRRGAGVLDAKGVTRIGLLRPTHLAWSRVRAIYVVRTAPRRDLLLPVPLGDRYLEFRAGDPDDMVVLPLEHTNIAHENLLVVLERLAPGLSERVSYVVRHHRGRELVRWKPWQRRDWEGWR